MCIIYMDNESELITVKCTDLKEAVKCYNECKKRFKWLKIILIANYDYLKSEKIKIKLVHNEG